MAHFVVITGSPSTPPVGDGTFDYLDGVANDMEMARNLWAKAEPEFLPNVTRNQIDATLSHKVERAEPGDTVIFFFSGHGWQEAASSVPEADGRREALGCSDGLYLDEYLTEHLHGFRPGVFVYTVLDACHALGLGLDRGALPKALPYDRRTRPDSSNAVFTIGASHESANAAQTEADGRAMGMLSRTIEEVTAADTDLTWRMLWERVSVRSQQETWVGGSLPGAMLSGPDGADDGFLDRPALLR